MDDFNILKGIPIPDPSKRAGHAKWGLLDIGDCVDVSRTTQRTAAYLYAKAHPPMRVQSQIQPDGRIRIWRIA